MKKTILLLLTLLISQASYSQLSGDTYDEAAKNKKATITALYLEEYPFAYKDDKGNAAGVEIDIFGQFVNWLKNAKGIELTVNYIPEKNFVKFFSSIQNGSNGVFGLGNITITDARKKIVQFTPPFMNNIAVLATHNSVPDLKSLDELGTVFKGKIGLATSGSTLEGYMKDLTHKYYPDAKLQMYESQTDVLNRVAEDPNTFGYMDLSIYWPAYNNEKLPIKRQEVADLSAEVFGFIMPLSSDWEPVIAEFFNLGSGYRSTNAYRTILIKHLGAEMTKMLEIARRK